MWERFIKFAMTDIWQMRLRHEKGSRSFLIRMLRIVVLAVKGFDEDKCMLRASSLTFYTLLSIVPVVAMLFAVAKGFGIEDKIEASLLEQLPGRSAAVVHEESLEVPGGTGFEPLQITENNFPTAIAADELADSESSSIQAGQEGDPPSSEEEIMSQEEMIKLIFKFARDMLDNTKGGLIAGIGVLLLFWTVIKVLGNIENAFNHIWGIKAPRTLTRKFSDYLSFMLVCPILLVSSSSITTFFTGNLEKIPFVQDHLGLASMVILHLASYVALWLLFGFIYLFMPNTKVNLSSALIAGIISGTVFHFFQWAYVTFQVGVSKYGAIYGSFAALPLFLMWLQFSWLVVLFGGELSFAHQNVETYEFEPGSLKVNRRHKNLLALLITRQINLNFVAGEKPWDATQLAHALDAPIRLMREVLYDLVQAEILMEIRHEEDKEISYQPARDVGVMTVKFVLDALEKRGDNAIPGVGSDDLQKLGNCLVSFDGLIEKSPANVPLINI